MGDGHGYKSCVPANALASLDRINTAIVNSKSLDDMLDAVLGDILDIFDCERAWVLQSRKPGADSVHMLAERYRPGFEGALALHGEFPIWEGLDAFLKINLNSNGPVRFDPLSGAPDFVHGPMLARFNIQSQMVMALRPLNENPWFVGIHHCREEYDL